MYYKEEWINGRLYWKSSPDGEWVEFTKEQYIERALKQSLEIKLLNIQLSESQTASAERLDALIELYGLAYVWSNDKELGLKTQF